LTSDRDLAREALAEWVRGHIVDAHEKELEFDERLLGAVARAIGRGRELSQREVLGEREVREKIERAYRKQDTAMGILFERLNKAGIDFSDLIS